MCYMNNKESGEGNGIRNSPRGLEVVTLSSWRSVNFITNIKDEYKL